MGLKVYTGGTFDLFHRGHVRLLRACSRLGLVTVALNTDEFVQQFKGKPTCTYDERLEVLQACLYVDRVVCNSGGADSKPTIEKVRPDVIVVGSDWASKDYHAQMGFTQDWLDERRIVLLYHDYTKGISSTAIRGRL